MDAKTLKNEIAVNVAKEAIIMTDEGTWYHGLRDDGSHRRVKHSGSEYARTDPDGVLVSTNTAEAFFCLLKRGHYGVFHQLSKKHLHRYCNEFGFRWNWRRVTDGERMVALLKKIEGRRLMYKNPSEN